MQKVGDTQESDPTRSKGALIAGDQDPPSTTGAEALALGFPRSVELTTSTLSSATAAHLFARIDVLLLDPPLSRRPR
jgi:hypothetical protein